MKVVPLCFVNLLVSVLLKHRDAGICSDVMDRLSDVVKADSAKVRFFFRVSESCCYTQITLATKASYQINLFKMGKKCFKNANFHVEHANFVAHSTNLNFSKIACHP